MSQIHAFPGKAGHVEDLRERARDAARRARTRVSRMAVRTGETARESLAPVSRYTRRHPVQVAGIAVGIGLGVGLAIYFMLRDR